MKRIETIIQRISALALEAYQAGVDDTLADIVSSVKSKGHGPAETNRPAEPRPGNGATKPNIDVTLSVIKLLPGQKGHQIIDTVAKHFPDIDRKVVARTTRTSFSRLQHKRGLIENRNGKWYPKEAKSNAP